MGVGVKISIKNIWSSCLATYMSVRIKRYKNCKSAGDTEEVYNGQLSLADANQLSLEFDIGKS